MLRHFLGQGVLAIGLTAATATVAVAVPVGPVHTMVCRCTCADPSGQGPGRIIDVEPIGGSCSSLKGATCDRIGDGNGGQIEGEIKDDCKKRVEPKTLVDALNDLRPEAPDDPIVADPN